MTSRAAVLLGAMLWLPGAAAFAQAAAPSDAPPQSGLLSPEMQALVDSARRSGRIGEWSEYAQLDANGKPDLRNTMRFLLLEGATPEAPPAVEIWLDKTGRFAVRMGPTLGSEAPQLVIKMGSAYFSLTDNKPAGQGATCGPDGFCGAGEKKSVPTKQVTLKTLAGTFHTEYVVQKTPRGTYELWQSREVPGLNLARMKGPNGIGLEIAAFGKDGQTAFARNFKANPLPFEQLGSVTAMMPRMNPGRAKPQVPADEKPALCDPATQGCGAQAPAPAPRP